MDRLGMSAEEQAQIVQILDYPHGIILVTGPTGSGKKHDAQRLSAEDQFDRTAHSSRSRTRSSTRYRRQTRCRCGPRSASPSPTPCGMSCAGSRCIMVAKSATGTRPRSPSAPPSPATWVFSTLHTNDAPGAITRLVDMGIEPFLVASAIELVIAQRLVRRLCVNCSKPGPGEQHQAAGVAGHPVLRSGGGGLIHELKQPVGCDRCRGTGYRGRIGLVRNLPAKRRHP